MEELRYQFGAWHVNPSDNSISDGQERRQMEPRAMDVLTALCKQANTIISPEQLLEQCWGTNLYGDNPVHKIITQLRKILGDKSAAPIYIETIRKRGYRTLAAVQFDYSESSQTGTWVKESPFRGLQAFDEQHAAIFFGRSDAIFQLTQVIKQQTGRSNSVELVMILGPSGSGKTSLVRAGLIPHLMIPKSPTKVLSHSSFDLAEKAESSLFTCLGGMLIDLEYKGHGLFPKHSALTLGQTLQVDLDAIISVLRHSIDTPHDGVVYRHSMFIDRLEVIFDEKLISGQEREDFLIIIDKLARSHSLIILLACRNDFYPQIAATPLLMDAKARGAHFDVSPPSHAEIAQMIRLPALAARLSFGVDPQSKIRLDDVLCQDTSGNPDALPLLQYTLHELYRLRSEAGELSFSTYHQLGGIEGAIGQRAEQVITTLDEAQRQSLPHVLSLVATISNNDAIVTSRRAGWAQLANDDERAVVNALVESRLFVSELVDGAPGFGVAHEALLRRWPRVVDWVNHHRSALQIRGRISELALRWDCESKRHDLLLPEGTQLDEACSLLELSTFSLSHQELSLIAASTIRVRWRKRLRRIALGSIITLAVLASGLGLSSMAAKRQAMERRIEVESLMSYMLGDFAEALRPLGKLDLLDSVGAKAIEYFAKNDEENLSETALIQRAVALHVLAEVRFTRGDPKSAIAVLETGHSSLLKQLEKRPKDLILIKNLADYASLFGKIHQGNNEWQKTDWFFRKHLEYSDFLNQTEPNNPFWWKYQSEAHVNLGGLAYYQKQFNIANSEFQLALKFKSLPGTKISHDIKTEAEIASIIGWMGTSKMDSGDLQAAINLYEQEADVYKKILKTNTSNTIMTGKLGSALGRQCRLQLAIGNKPKAFALCREAERLLNRVLEIEPNNSVWLRELTVAQLEIQKSLPNETNPRAILNALNEINTNTKKLTLIDPKPDWILREAALQQEIAKQLLKIGDLSAANEKLSTTQTVLENLLSKNPNSIGITKHLTITLLKQAELENLKKNHSAAQKICMRGYELLKNIAAESTDFHILDPWVRLNLCLKNYVDVEITHKKLTAMAYREGNYVQAMSKRNP